MKKNRKNNLYVTIMLILGTLVLSSCGKKSPPKLPEGSPSDYMGDAYPKPEEWEQVI